MVGFFYDINNNMKKKKNTEQQTIFLLRSIYINDKAANGIFPDFFYILAPSESVNKLTEEQIGSFLYDAYNENFDNVHSIMKMRQDFEDYIKVKTMNKYRTRK